MINKATPLIEGFAQELVSHKVAAGLITIENDFADILGRYFSGARHLRIKLNSKNKTGFYYMLSMIAA